MEKKVLILAGSPRTGGNSDLLCDAFPKNGRCRLPSGWLTPTFRR